MSNSLVITFKLLCFGPKVATKVPECKENFRVLRIFQETVYKRLFDEILIMSTSALSKVISQSNRKEILSCCIDISSKVTEMCGTLKDNHQDRNAGH